jgi:chromosomal replication initiation ATPase DnaA
MTPQRIGDRLAALEQRMAALTAAPLLLRDGGVVVPVLREPGLRTIAEACCVAWDVSLPAFLGLRRTAHLVRARWAAACIARANTSHSFPVMARAWRRDHTTLLHGCRQAKRLLQAGDEDFTARLAEARALLSTTIEGTKP